MTRTVHVLLCVVASLVLLATGGCRNSSTGDFVGGGGGGTAGGALAVTITSPGPGFVTAEAMIDVEGTYGGAVSITVNGVEADLKGDGTFSVDDVPLSEGTNVLVATAVDENGVTLSAARSTRKDTAAPVIVIETPAEGDRFVSDMIPVAGTVNDVIPGATINEDDVTVTVNGVEVPVLNKGFLLDALPLALGDNEITATVTDLAGNTSTHTITVSLEPDLTGIEIRAVSGNAQEQAVETTLAEEFVVQVLDADDAPIAGRVVVFRVSKGDGLLGDPLDELQQVSLLTDADGMASQPFTLGRRTGEGFHRARVTTPGSLTFTEFCATGTAADPDMIAVNDPPPKQALAGQLMTDPLTAIVTDAGGNPAPGVDVTFTIALGGGSFPDADDDGEPEEMVVVPTDMDGIAEAFWTLGSAGKNRATADFEGNTGFGAVFEVKAIESGPVEDTMVSGIVLDSTLAPIVGATAMLVGTELEATTGPGGRFEITDVPPGSYEVLVMGSTANGADPGEEAPVFPDIAYEIEAVAGVDNRLDQDVVLPFLDMDGAKEVGGDEDVLLGMEGVPGFRVRVFANSTIVGEERKPVVMSSSQVKFDKVPMTPPQGSVPLVVGTLQPGGIHFDPPAQVTYPNTAGLAPGDVGEMFAFHHDIGQFVNIGPGTVSEDGSVVTSNPGFGLLQSGWHCLISIPGPTAHCANDCTADLEWQHIKEDGTLGPVNNGGPVELSCSNEDQAKAKVKVTFGPGGGTFDSEEWTGGNGLTLEDASAGGTMAMVTVTAGETIEETTITSPLYRIELDDEPDKTCQAEIEVVAADIKFLDRSMKKTTFANVAKWASAFEGTAPNNVTAKKDFHESDTDRFFVQIKDAGAKGKGKIKATIRTRNKDGDLVDKVVNFELQETPADSGTFKSEPFVLVSNQVDDDFDANNVADGNAKDPTLLVFDTADLTGDPLNVLIGGRVTAHYNPSNEMGPTDDGDEGECSAEIDICKQGTIKNVTVRPIILRDAVGGNALATEADFRETFAQMNTVWSQCCIRIVGGGSIITADPPAAEAFDDVGFDHDNDPLTPDQNPTVGAFDFIDTDMDGLHDMGEPSEPFTDGNGNMGYDFGVDLSDGLDEFPNLVAPTREERSLLDSLADGNAKTIELYVVNNLSAGSRGEAFATDVPGFVDNLKTVNQVIINNSSVGVNGSPPRDNFVTAPHEIGHVILVPNGDHTDRNTIAGRVNLMVGGGTDGTDCVTCSKRLTAANCTDARKF